ncbi:MULTISPECIES: class I SAM-dependent methyltransferase [Protofrankia]|uniref:Methyltransferase type 11 n=1 Tax=Candidatus Protofrankia datiscae TaxID=2716812 RepID=F8B498_9ACTN|nr:MULTISPECIES: class I SAM-dependent methyltransferase [Protofrankia]AEH11017.1 Methyltransferase type 11 [Candidatus Protofrankia datiscae]
MPGHPDPVAINTAVWEQHARARIAAGDLDTRPAIHRFRWTRTGVNDPGAELFGDIRGKRVVELGCGTGDNLAYLVDRCGARGVGIDAAPSQIRRARARWPSPVFHCTDAARYLATCEPIDVCYSGFWCRRPVPAGSAPGPDSRSAQAGRLACLLGLGLPGGRWDSTAAFQRPTGAVSALSCLGRWLDQASASILLHRYPGNPAGPVLGPGHLADCRSAISRWLKMENVLTLAVQAVGDGVL